MVGGWVGGLGAGRKPGGKIDVREVARERRVLVGALGVVGELGDGGILFGGGFGGGWSGMI